MRTLLVLASLVPTLAARADILNVPADFPTIQAAIDAAQDGDEIVLAAGIYESPDILVDRSITLTIRSTDPGDPAVVAATLLTDQDDAGVLTVRGDNSGVNIELSVRGVTFARPAEQTLDPLIDVEGASADFYNCRFDGGGAPAQSGGMVRSDASPDGRVTFVSVQSCEFLGNAGELAFSETVVTWTDVSARDANLQVTVSAGAAGTIAMNGCAFSNVTTSPGPVIEILNRDSGAPSSIVNTTFEDVPTAGIRCDGDLSLRNVSIERCGSLLDRDGRFIEVEFLEIDGLVVRDCHVIPDNGTNWFINARDELVARDLLFERNTGADMWLHALTDFQPGGFLIEDAMFRNNSATTHVLEAHSNGVYRRCTFEHNTITNGFGALGTWGAGSNGVIRNKDVLLEDCVFRYNKGGFAPFGLQRHVTGRPIIARRCVFEGNEAAVGGVAAGTPNNSILPNSDIGDEWLVLQNCVFIGNVGAFAGVHLGSVRYESCIMIANTGGESSLGVASATLIDSAFIPDDDTQLLVVHWDVLWDFLDDEGVSVVESSHSIVPESAQGTSTTSLDPLFVRTPNDGGDGWGDDPDTPDVDESLNDDFGDLRLRAGSPAIDAGSRGIMRFFETDLAGNPRLRDDPGIPDDGRNGRVDIGAYEFQGTTCLPDVNQDGLVTPADFSAWITAFNTASPLADQNRDGKISPADFSVWIANFNLGCP